MIKNIFYLLFSLVIFVPAFYVGGTANFVIDLVAISLALFGVLYFFDKKEVIFHKKRNNPTIISFLALFLAFGFFGLAYSKSPYLSFYSWFEYLVYAFLFLLVIKLDIGRIKFKCYSALLSLVASGLSIAGIYIFLTGSYSRLTSLFYWPNPFATYLMLALPFSYFWYKKDISYLKLRSAPLLISILTALFLTGSRGAFVSFLIVGLFLFIREFNYLKENIKPLLSVIILSILFISSIIYIKNSSESFLSRELLEGESLDVSSGIRLSYYKAGLSIFSNYPLFGSGLGTFSQIYHQYQSSPVNSGKYVHNWYLEVLLESGVFVFFSLFIFLFLILFSALKYLKSDRVFIVFISVLSYLIHNLVDIGSHYIANNIIFWFNLGLLLSLISESDQSKYKACKVGKQLFVVLSIFIILVSAAQLHSKYNLQLAKQAEVSSNYIEANSLYKESVKFYSYPQYLRRLGLSYYTLTMYSANPADINQYQNSALKLANHSVSIEPLNALNYEQRGRVHEIIGNTTKAQKDLSQAVLLDKFNPRYTISLASLLIQEKKYKEALSAINQLLDYYPKDVVERKKIIIMSNQKIISGIEKEIDFLKYLRDVVNKRIKEDGII
ncbi:O-antigen ligase family protein [Patescibacteria group bacterium]|nr:O-antigen ligase family protein [Patescibacteria group bacterium]